MLIIPGDVKSSGQKFSRALTSLVRVDDLSIQKSASSSPDHGEELAERRFLTA
jgi:hypothetical protein